MFSFCVKITNERREDRATIKSGSLTSGFPDPVTFACLSGMGLPPFSAATPFTNYPLLTCYQTLRGKDYDMSKTTGLISTTKGIFPCHKLFESRHLFLQVSRLVGWYRLERLTPESTDQQALGFVEVIELAKAQ
jgi:hypothetical protein